MLYLHQLAQHTHPEHAHHQPRNVLPLQNSKGNIALGNKLPINIGNSDFKTPFTAKSHLAVPLTSQEAPVVVLLHWTRVALLCSLPCQRTSGHHAATTTCTSNQCHKEIGLSLSQRCSEDSDIPRSFTCTVSVIRLILLYAPIIA